MVVCKFFLQGNCRYGQHCRFEHVYGSKYSYHVNSSHQSAVNQQQTPSVPSVADLVKQVQTDIQAALKGNQWILSCYAPFKEKPLFPGIHDVSPEEIRLFIYEAKANNTVVQAISHINHLVEETRQKYERLLQPDTTITKILSRLYKGETAESPFHSSLSITDKAASSIFRSAVQGQAPVSSIFNRGSQSLNPKDIFAQAANQSAISQNANVFNNPPQQTDAKSLFAHATQNVRQQTSQNIFAVPNQNTQQPTIVFAEANKIFFGQEKQLPSFEQTQSSDFQKSKPSLQPTNVFQDKFDASVYSRLEDLTSDELEAFKSDSFQLGFIPEIAPPWELCK